MYTQFPNVVNTETETGIINTAHCIQMHCCVTKQSDSCNNCLIILSTVDIINYNTITKHLPSIVALPTVQIDHQHHTAATANVILTLTTSSTSTDGSDRPSFGFSSSRRILDDFHASECATCRSCGDGEREMARERGDGERERRARRGDDQQQQQQPRHRAGRCEREASECPPQIGAMCTLNIEETRRGVQSL